MSIVPRKTKKAPVAVESDDVDDEDDNEDVAPLQPAFELEDAFVAKTASGKGKGSVLSFFLTIRNVKISITGKPLSLFPNLDLASLSLFSSPQISSQLLLTCIYQGTSMMTIQRWTLSLRRD